MEGLGVEEAIGEHPQHEEPKRSESEEYKKVVIHPDYLDQKFQVGKELPPPLKEDIIRFLFDHLKNFAWCSQDILGIDPSIVEHSLNIDPTYKPVK